MNTPIFAHIHGEPLTTLPQDLYIPPDALELILENFQGPLDLLLYLIRRHNLDILDIPMVELTRQYLSYIDLMQQHRLELAAEYLLMAAMLIEIKSRMLLPPPAKEEEDETEDPRAELMRRLLEYEQIKLAAQEINQLPLVEREFDVAQVLFERQLDLVLPEINVNDLRQAWLGMLHRAKLRKHHVIQKEQLSVREQMSHILRCLKGDQYIEFDSLFELDGGIPKLIVTFVALLELAKEYLVEIQQADQFGKIYLRAHQGEQNTEDHAAT